jgi:hypothetical protein
VAIKNGRLKTIFLLVFSLPFFCGSETIFKLSPAPILSAQGGLLWLGAKDSNLYWMIQSHHVNSAGYTSVWPFLPCPDPDWHNIGPLSLCRCAQIFHVPVQDLHPGQSILVQRGVEWNVG